MWRDPLKIGKIALCGVSSFVFATFTAFYQDPNSWVPSIVYIALAAVLYVAWSMTGGKKQDKG